MSRYHSYHIFVTVVVVLGGVVWVSAGNLSPPAGPVAPTMKTLTDVEPRIAVNDVNTPGDPTALHVISQPGSYYLTGNITGVSDKSGIAVYADDVTIDLNGHVLMGVAGSGNGIQVPPGAADTGLTVRDGTLRGWGMAGIDTYDVNTRAVNLRCANNGGYGMSLGDNSIATECTAVANAGVGIRAGDHCRVRDCVADSNGSHGIRLSDYSTVSGCCASDNGGDGIQTAMACTVTCCTVRGNGGDGIDVGGGGSVKGCTVNENDGQGILITSTSYVVGNHCGLNGMSASDGAGIHATGLRNRIEGNNVTINFRGIDVDLGGNIIVRNTARANAIDYDIAAGNASGPILDYTAGGTINDDKPWANFRY